MTASELALWLDISQSAWDDVQEEAIHPILDRQNHSATALLPEETALDLTVITPCILAPLE